MLVAIGIVEYTVLHRELEWYKYAERDGNKEKQKGGVDYFEPKIQIKSKNHYYSNKNLVLYYIHIGTKLQYMLNSKFVERKNRKSNLQAKTSGKLHEIANSYWQTALFRLAIYWSIAFFRFECGMKVKLGLKY